MAPHAEGWYYCQFDSVVVFADSFQENPSVPNVWTVTFVVPPLPRGNVVAKLAISEDGFNFQDFGVFEYQGEAVGGISCPSKKLLKLIHVIRKAAIHHPYSHRTALTKCVTSVILAALRRLVIPN